jgi:hypothetical protein
LLGERHIHSFPVATRMSWAARRSTTRTEDIAYCLLWIFGVNIPLLYGEGRRAFQSLQEEIFKVVDDYTTAWPYFGNNSPKKSVLASSPAAFTNVRDRLLLHSHGFTFPDIDINSVEPPRLTAKGLRMTLPLLRRHSDGACLAYLYCRNSTNNQPVCMLLERDFISGEFYR